MFRRIFRRRRKTVDLNQEIREVADLYIDLFNHALAYQLAWDEAKHAEIKTAEDLIKIADKLAIARDNLFKTCSQMSNKILVLKDE